MPNLLANEKSLYLLQHANNPVEWYPWGEDALRKAREEDKPLLISIGYSACHWCHVMAHESFENEYIAQLMNAHFVCVKVDREERPEVDRMYMESVQMVNGHGGWPLNVFCLPDGRPFIGGTYFPPDESRGMSQIPWPQILLRVSEHYKRRKEDLVNNAESILKNLDILNQPVSASSGCCKQKRKCGGQKSERSCEGNCACKNDCDEHPIINAVSQICATHDDEWGGFGEAPKFPPSMTLDLLMTARVYIEKDEEVSAVEETDAEKAKDKIDRIDEVVNTTLTRMAYGGMYDQIGGGFARYSVDRFWHIPHFEKMLYDNALLIYTYTKAWLRYREPLYKAVVEETIEWLSAEMFQSEGGFSAAIDADADGEEGQTYLWTAAQVAAALDESQAAGFCQAYGITEEGNFENGYSNPMFQGQDFAQRQSFVENRALLLQLRNQRTQPAKDKKRLVAWNSLLITALAEAGFYFGKKEWFALARQSADWIWEKCLYDRNRLKTVVYGEEASLNGCLDDYAFYSHALLMLASKVDWISANESKRYIERAEVLVETVIEQFFDKDEETGFYLTSEDHEPLIHRGKVWFDNALPTGNTSLLHVFSALHALTGKALYQSHWERLSQSYSGIMKRIPNGAPHALEGLVNHQIGIAVIKVKAEALIERLQERLSQRPWRKVFICFTDDSSQSKNYQLCVGTQCFEPSDDVETVIDKL